MLVTRADSLPRFQNYTLLSTSDLQLPLTSSIILYSNDHHKPYYLWLSMTSHNLVSPQREDGPAGGRGSVSAPHRGCEVRGLRQLHLHDGQDRQGRGGAPDHPGRDGGAGQRCQQSAEEPPPTCPSRHRPGGSVVEMIVANPNKYFRDLQHLTSETWWD